MNKPTKLSAVKAVSSRKLGRPSSRLPQTESSRKRGRPPSSLPQTESKDKAVGKEEKETEEEEELLTAPATPSQVLCTLDESTRFTSRINDLVKEEVNLRLAKVNNDQREEKTKSAVRAAIEQTKKECDAIWNAKLKTAVATAVANETDRIKKLLT